MAKASIYRRGNKYRAIKTKVDGYTFDSKAEASRYGELKLLEQSGYIRDLVVHPKFELIAGITYTADFSYQEPTGIRLRPVDVVVEDVKSPATRTAHYKDKVKLLKHCFPQIRFTEVMKT